VADAGTLPDAGPSPDEGPDPARVLVRLGLVRRAHGICGGLRVEYFGEDPLCLPDLAGVVLEPPDGGTPRPARVLRVKVSPPGVILALDGVRDREAAERLRGFRVSAPRGSLPPPAEDEFYQADLIGLPVMATDGRSLGRVAGFADFGGTPNMEVLTPSGATVMIPWTGDFIREAGPEEGRVLVEDAPGLLDQG
jgi:16S rRNA processing protein RimM